MNDLYSKAIMMIIAVALTVIAGNQLFGSARAQSDCGASYDPCYVTGTVEVEAASYKGLKVWVR